MKIRNLLLTATAVTTAAVAMMSGGSADDVMTRSADGTYVVNTTTLAPTVKGYAGATPLKIHIKNDRVVKIASRTTCFCAPRKGCSANGQASMSARHRNRK